MKICTFCGHSKIADTNLLYKKLVSEIRHLACLGVTEFYSGGYGDFDSLAVRAVFEVQAEFPNIQNTIVVPYITENHLSRYEYTLEKYNAITIYPFETEVLPKFAISKRNEWMVDNSDYIISYVKRDWGGAFNTYEYARRKKKVFIDLTIQTPEDFL
ncbi:MAG: SLOG family protein [Bacillota bacterium]